MDCMNLAWGRFAGGYIGLTRRSGVDKLSVEWLMPASNRAVLTPATHAYNCRNPLLEQYVMCLTCHIPDISRPHCLDNPVPTLSEIDIKPGINSGAIC